MAHLIKLELKKFGIARNVIFMVAAILFSILFITISLWDSMTDPEQTKDTFESTYLVIGLLMSFIFLVYSSVLTARLVIGEYNQRTITIMFSYPLNRTKLIASKLIIIMVYTAISMAIGYVCCSGYIVFVDRFFDMLEGTFQLSMLFARWVCDLPGDFCCFLRFFGAGRGRHAVTDERSGANSFIFSLSRRSGVRR